MIEQPATDRKMLSDVGKMASASAAAQLVTVVGGLALAKLLGVSTYGLWKTVQLAVTYTAFANLGATYGLSRLCPAVVSAGREAVYNRMMSASLAVSWLIGGALSLLFLFWSMDAPDPAWRTAGIALAVLCAIQPFAMHGETALIVEKRFGANARVLLGSTLARVGFSIGAAWVAGLAGALAVYVVVYGLASVWMARLVAAKLRPAFAMPLWRKTTRVGVPITLLAGGELLLGTADKWVVVGLLGAEAMSLYQMAVFPLPFLMLIPFNLRQVVTVDVYDKFGRTGSLAECRGVFETSLLGIALGAPWLVGGVYFGMPWLVSTLLPEYRAAIPLVLAHTVLVFPLMAMQVAIPLVVVAKRRGEVLGVMLGATGAAVACGILAVRVFGAGAGAVLGFQAAAWLVAAGWTIGRCFWWTGSRAEAAAIRAALCLAPLAALAIALPLVSAGVEGLGLRRYGFAHAAACGVVFTALCGPLVLALEQRTRGVSYFARRIAGRFRRPARSR